MHLSHYLHLEQSKNHGQRHQVETPPPPPAPFKTLSGAEVLTVGFMADRAIVHGG